jgi:hypothetical protein
MKILSADNIMIIIVIVWAVTFFGWMITNDYIQLHNPENIRLFNDTMWCEDRCYQYKMRVLYPDTERNFIFRCLMFYKDDTFVKRCINDVSKKI